MGCLGFVAFGDTRILTISSGNGRVRAVILADFLDALAYLGPKPISTPSSSPDPGTLARAPRLDDLVHRYQAGLGSRRFSGLPR